VTRHSDNATHTASTGPASTGTDAVAHRASPDDEVLAEVIFGDLPPAERAAVAERAVAEAIFGDPAAERAVASERDSERDDEAGDAPLPSFTEQVSEQIGGVRGLIESSIPVLTFVVINVVGGWVHLSHKLNVAIILAVATALGIAVFRLTRRQPVRHAVNGLFGIALGAWLAWRSGDERAFYLPGIFLSLGYGVAMLVSVAFRQPLVGWIWSVVVAGGSKQWRDEPRLVRTFGWLTVLWAAIYILKTVVQTALYLADQATALGVVRIVFGYPPYLLLLALTVWAVRRTRERMGASA
jgi:hypothetical protein